MRRVVITGIGCRTPLGDSYEVVKNNLYTGVRVGEFLEPNKLPVCKVKTNLEENLNQFDQTITDRIARLAWGAFEDCKKDSGLSEFGGVFIGVGFTAATVEQSGKDFMEKGRVRPNTLIHLCPNGPASFIALKENIKGPNITYNTACSSSTLAIGEAYGYISRGEADSMIVGGVESPIGPYSVASWVALKAISTETEDAKMGCRPFDKKRKGVMLAEGSVIYCLESLESALKRNAKIYAEVLGYGISWGTETFTKPSIEGESESMRKALSKIGDRKVTYINAHGTGTTMGDLVELTSIKQVFGDETPNIPVSSTKALHGHLLGASGAMETLSCIAVLETNKIIPNWNLTEPDDNIPEGLNLPTSVVDKEQDVCYNNSFAFGGTNVTLALGKYESKTA